MRDYADLVNALRMCKMSIPCNDCPFYSRGDMPSKECATMNDAAADAIDELLAAVPHWVSVEKRLPEAGERVLVSNGGFVCESFLSQSGRWQRGGVDMFFMAPTHWMPLPKPPKEVE